MRLSYFCQEAYPFVGRLFFLPGGYSFCQEGFLFARTLSLWPGGFSFSRKAFVSSSPSPIMAPVYTRKQLKPKSNGVV